MCRLWKFSYIINKTCVLSVDLCSGQFFCICLSYEDVGRCGYCTHCSSCFWECLDTMYSVLIPLPRWIHFVFFFFIIVSYSLAPEAHFPQPYYDALMAATFFLRPEVLAQYSVDPRRVAISGDSSGGNLAAAVVQQVGKKVGDSWYCHSTNVYLVCMLQAQWRIS